MCLLMDKYGLKNCGAYMQWDFIQLLKSFLKEDADICNNMDKPGGLKSKWNKPDTER